ncbi:hypothetical protein [Haloferax sp. Q22]|uniref:hypothetical protein n=1 Tax=Haloferax sp. (strain Q22) TaxID=1526048 RepID=UPI0012F88131|nr:hypothetical protein [Haloferax sp. Q22]
MEVISRTDRTEAGKCLGLLPRNDRERPRRVAGMRFSAAATERKRGVAVANAVAVAVEGDRLLAVVEYRS